MTSESPYEYKVDIRAIGTALIQLSPIILVVLYILEYLYVFQFLEQFGVTPEEVGISEIKLLTRAALLTLVVVSLLGIIFVTVGTFVAVRASIEESTRIRRIRRKLNRIEFLRRRNLIKQPEGRNRNNITESIRTASQQAQFVRYAGALSFTVIIAVIIRSMKPLGIQLDITAIVILVAADITLSAALFVGWRNNSVRYLVYACGTVLAIAALSLAAVYGGVNKGYYTATTGRVSLVNLLGIDILQVHPEWIDKGIIPPQYTQNQNLLELGSDATTTFLYDCWTATTYRVPLDDVVLTYPLYLNQYNSATLRLLRCH
jgi:hypothetical protein